MKSLVIVGAGGLGREVAFLVEEINAAAPDQAAKWDLRGFADDDPALQEKRVQDVPVLGTVEWLAEQRSNLHYALALGDPAVRRRLARSLSNSSLEAATLVHPSVPIHRTTRVEAGAIVCRGVTLTVAVHIGAHALIDVHATASHDAAVDDFATIHPGVHLTGNTRIGNGAEMGTGAVVLPGVSVGARATVGAGAVVRRDLPAGCTAVGVPARPLPS